MNTNKTGTKRHSETATLTDCQECLLLYQFRCFTLCNIYIQDNHDQSLAADSDVIKAARPMTMTDGKLLTFPKVQQQQQLMQAPVAFQAFHD
jgi:hypothetical protein